MASLKEIKGRIASVTSTMKITGAMKMIASAKLHRAQTALEQLRPYGRQLDGMLAHLLASGETIDSPWLQTAGRGKIAWVVCASNTGLCGAFNANVEKEFLKRIAGSSPQDRLIFPLGRKIREFLEKNGIAVAGNFDALAEKPDYEAASALAGTLMDGFASGEIREVDVLYHRFHNRIVQVLTADTFLPLRFTPEEQPAGEAAVDYLVEPSAGELVETLLPQVLRLRFYTCLLDNQASEHGARTTAMQQATDNASDLLQQLTVQYNKSRQQSITNELLDIAGGSAR